MIWGLSGAPLAFSADLSTLGGRKDGCLPFSSLSFQICEEPKPSGYLPGSREAIRIPGSEPGFGSPCQGCLSLCLASHLFTWASGRHLLTDIGASALGPVAWEGHSAWKALGPMPWFGKWVRPLAWGVLEQGHVALARLDSNGRNGENRTRGVLVTSFTQPLLSWGGPSVVWKKGPQGSGVSFSQLTRTLLVQNMRLWDTSGMWLNSCLGVGCFSSPLAWASVSAPVCETGRGVC